MSRRTRVARERRLRASPYKVTPMITVNQSTANRSIGQSLKRSTHVVFDSEPESEPILRYDPVSAGQSQKARKRVRPPRPVHVVFDNDLFSDYSANDDSESSFGRMIEAVEPVTKRYRTSVCHEDNSNEAMNQDLSTSHPIQSSVLSSPSRWSSIEQVSIDSDPSLAMNDKSSNGDWMTSSDYDADTSEDDGEHYSTSRPLVLVRQISLVIQTNDVPTFSRSISLPLALTVKSSVEEVQHLPRHVEFSAAAHRSLSQPSWMMSSHNDEENDEDDDTSTDDWSDEDVGSDVSMMSSAEPSCDTTDELSQQTVSYHEYSLPSPVEHDMALSDEEEHVWSEDDNDSSSLIDVMSRSFETNDVSSVNSVSVAALVALDVASVDASSSTGSRVKRVLKRASIGILVAVGALPWAAALADYAGFEL